MPQAVELGVRSRSGSGGAVAEADDRDARDEIEVSAPLVVPDAAAVPPHDREVGPRIGGEHRVAQRRRRPRLGRSQRCHAVTSVAPIAAAHAAARRDHGGRQAWARCRPRRRRRRASGRRRRRRSASITASSTITPATSVTKRIRAAPSPTASAAAASSALTLRGPSARGAITGTRPAASASSTAAGADGSGSPTSPIASTLARTQPDLVPEQADRGGTDGRADLGVDRPPSRRARSRAPPASSRGGHRQTTAQSRASPSLP